MKRSSPASTDSPGLGTPPVSRGGGAMTRFLSPRAAAFTALGCLLLGVHIFHAEDGGGTGEPEPFQYDRVESYLELSLQAPQGTGDLLPGTPPAPSKPR